MPRFEQRRHAPPAPLDRPRELVVACPPMRSNVNLSRILRAAGSCGVRRMICCGTARLIGKIARDAESTVHVETHRTLLHPLRDLRAQGYTAVGLEQATGSVPLWDFPFPRRTVLVVGNEREGIAPDLLAELDAAVEIPVYGKPDAYNAATAACMALYEYIRQHPRG